MERNAELDASIKALQAKKAEYQRDILESESVAKELKETSVQCARQLDLQHATLAESARAFVSQYGDRENHRGVDSRASARAALNGVERSERKLELKLLTRVGLWGGAMANHHGVLA